MAKTNLELQEAFRMRKLQEDEVETRYETWISSDTRNEIGKLARHTGKKPKELIAEAIHEFHLATMRAMSSDADREHYQRPLPPPSPKKTKYIITGNISEGE